MKITSRENLPDLPYSLPDMSVTGLEMRENERAMRLEQGFVKVGKPCRQTRGSAVFDGVGRDFFGRKQAPADLAAGRGECLLTLYHAACRLCRHAGEKPRTKGRQFFSRPYYRTFAGQKLLSTRRG